MQYVCVYTILNNTQGRSREEYIAAKHVLRNWTWTVHRNHDFFLFHSPSQTNKQLVGDAATGTCWGPPVWKSRREAELLGLLWFLWHRVPLSQFRVCTYLRLTSIAINKILNCTSLDKCLTPFISLPTLSKHNCQYRSLFILCECSKLLNGDSVGGYLTSVELLVVKFVIKDMIYPLPRKSHDPVKTLECQLPIETKDIMFL